MLINKIKQDNRTLRPEIQRWGGYFLCLHYYTSLFKKREFSAYEINAAYYRFIGLGYIKSNCFIINPCMILNYYGIRSSVRYETANYLGAANEFEISEVKIDKVNGYHFIATKNKEILYDSLDLKPRGKIFKVTSKRIFRLK
ncbi:DUF261 domain-containing protein [Borreliella burgdorferi]|uniref:DUF261 domain-containing protein n=1 Tax=Borreliella burgdorferi TaxID=139 RepID=UPI00017F2A4D|nr:DUF261 domain-containing protein [Borreliella burgdorferi]ADQ29002.1 BppB [Borreliella burgdorferi N40]ADQ29965.1 BppB [Borreliella burgdorferi N40]PRR45582.1 DUF261 domain-containing protein [Borreliella burgdorferi]PRR56370.1 DUF261 domain-containing protein [Borreliella burgdorferi]